MTFLGHFGLNGQNATKELTEKEFIVIKDCIVFVLSA